MNKNVLALMMFVAATATRSLAATTTCALPSAVREVLSQQSHQENLSEKETLDKSDPCTRAGMTHAASTFNADYANRAYLKILKGQKADAVHFSECALNAKSGERGVQFATAALQAGENVLYSSVKTFGITPITAARARHLQVVAKWILANPCASRELRATARQELRELREIVGE